MTDKHQELIDDYLSGRVQYSEEVPFDSPDFKFQQEVIEGIKSYREAELKSRMGSINVNPGFIGLVKSSALMQTIGGVMIASLIGVGVWFYANQPEETNLLIVVDLPEKYTETYPWSIPNVEVASRKTTTDEKKEEIIHASKKTSLAKQKAASKDLAEEYVPNVQLPTTIDIEDETTFTSSKLEEIEKEAVSKQENATIEVETKNTKSLSIQYKYYDGKLFLSGDFDRAPYEIIEINSTSSRRIFIKYLDKYYKVSLTDKLKNLPEVKSQEVIRELELLKAIK